MKKLLGVLMAFVLFGGVMSCGFGMTKLNDEVIAKYIAAYSIMKEKGIADSGEGMNDAALNDAAKAGGFKDYAEFVNVQIAVGAALAVVSTTEYVNQMDALASPEYDAWQAMLTNPDIPEADKENAKKEIEKAKAEWEKNKAAAEPAMGMMNMLVDKDSVEAVKKHYNELLAVMGNSDAVQ
ncbi:MAG: hypothetical protein A2Y33_02120 [Spirochaetes bacterium GWF1_51_8]|nr:MAG: hypothetical protein A2Y33_02120 [Spirochaetes bacterium GWF1_51_8]